MGAVKAMVFDLDGTLAPSKQEMQAGLAKEFARLTRTLPTGVISGGSFNQFSRQLLAPLQTLVFSPENLHLMPTCGTRYYRFKNDEWRAEYVLEMDQALAKRAKKVIEEVARSLGYWCDHPAGEIIEDRGSQLTYSALGQQAGREEKEAWDPSGKKRAEIATCAGRLLPELTVLSGGSTSVDITMKGIDKAYGVGEFLEQTGFDPGQVLFVGDRLDPDGNDYPAVRTGVQTCATSGPEQTQEIITQVLSG
ncbi:HAD-IIB family hydrolase [Varibaculum vaginae]|uniref:HAD-IIB family hydrolase n=1 Tax=Varibaculum vaginae TaxID=2364797 RepID=UPI000F07A513|nr:HAD-IIB family hydrolase [Varibaculum vaginae]